MSIGNVAFITIALFMVHEFDEIIFIRRYIDRHARDRRYSTEMFIAGAGNYPSTESVAVMICEEFIDGDDHRHLHRLRAAPPRPHP